MPPLRCFSCASCRRYVWDNEPHAPDCADLDRQVGEYATLGGYPVGLLPAVRRVLAGPTDPTLVEGLMAAHGWYGRTPPFPIPQPYQPRNEPALPRRLAASEIDELRLRECMGRIKRNLKVIKQHRLLAWVFGIRWSGRGG